MSICNRASDRSEVAPVTTTVRRIVTGELASGGVVTEIGKAKPLPARGGATYFGLWGWRAPITLPIQPAGAYAPQALFPEPGGVEVVMFEFPTGYGLGRPDDADIGEAFKRLEDAGRKVVARDESSGRHKTDSVDVAFVISGEMTLLPAGGAEVVLRPGDCLIQNGAEHSWRNRGSDPCLVAFVFVGAERTDR